ncbi:class F sortase [Streptomyces sp. RPT161]|uniref:class F sortase n=1 Tax=Streptomyces sp. RPT161 TaxID=3015993 RepID=UPI0022B8829F|nr:class F sortase [Streptomyces sp. RPT161]
MRRTTARSSELRVNGAAVLLLLISAALCAWALLYTPDGSGTRVHGAYAATAASTTGAPVQIDIPRAGVHAKAVPVGATSPALSPQCAGWYAASAAPGDPGRSVIIGDRAVFHGLPRLRPHDAIEISRADGTHVCYSVTDVEHDAAQTPRQPVAVLGPKATTAAQLELITPVTANETVVVHADQNA